MHNFHAFIQYTRGSSSLILCASGANSSSSRRSNPRVRPIPSKICLGVSLVPLLIPTGPSRVDCCISNSEARYSGSNAEALPSLDSTRSICGSSLSPFMPCLSKALCATLATLIAIRRLATNPMHVVMSIIGSFGGKSLASDTPICAA